MNRFLLLASLFTLSAGLSAHVVRAETTSHVKLFDTARISQRTLPNGVRSVVQEAPGTDLVSVQVWVRAGSRFETRENNGVTHLIETLGLRASQSYSEKTAGPRGALESLGGAAGSLTSRDSMFFSATVAAPFLPSALKILSDVVLHPDLSDAKIEVAKSELLSELVALAGDPTRQGSDLAYDAMFGKHSYRLPAQGSPVSLAALTGAKVRAYHAARFAGKNISVIISGDAGRENAHQLALQYFGGAPKAGNDAAIASDKPLSSVVKTSRKGVLPVTTLVLAWRSPPLSDTADVVALDVLLAHWKEGRDAALRRILRAVPLKADEKAEGDDDDSMDDAAPKTETKPEAAPKEKPEVLPPLAAAFDADFLTQRDSGLFSVTLLGPRDKAEAINAILEEIARLQREGISPAELERAKTLLRGQYLAQSDTPSGLAGALGFYEMIGDYKFAATYLDRVARVSNDDIKHLANTYLTPQAYVQVTIEGRVDSRPPDEGGTITASLSIHGDQEQGRPGEGA